MKLVDRIAFLKTTDLLPGVPDNILAQVGGHMEEIEAKGKQRFSDRGISGMRSSLWWTAP